MRSSGPFSNLVKTDTVGRLPDFGDSYALLIGVADYRAAIPPETGAFDAVPAALHNLTRLRSVLSPITGGGFDRSACRMISNPNTGEGIRAAVQQASHQAGDVFLLYYVGHGLKIGEELYLASSTSTPESMETTGIRYETVRKLIRASRAAIRIIILDCCFSGVAATGLLGAEKEIGLAQGDVEISTGGLEDDDEGVCVIASSGPNQPSRDSDGTDYTAFTGHLLSSLTAVEPAGPRDIQSVFSATRRSMKQAKLEHAPLISSEGGAIHVALTDVRAIPAVVAAQESVPSLITDETVPSAPAADDPRAEIMTWRTPLGLTMNFYDKETAAAAIRLAIEAGVFALEREGQ